MGYYAFFRAIIYVLNNRCEISLYCPERLFINFMFALKEGFHISVFRPAKTFYQAVWAMFPSHKTYKKLLFW